MKKKTLGLILIGLSLPTTIAQFAGLWVLACVLLNAQLLLAYTFGWPLLQDKE